jgi:hypothetical protein
VGKGGEWRKRRVGEWVSGKGEELGKFFLFLLPSSFFLTSVTSVTSVTESVAELPSSFNIY